MNALIVTIEGGGNVPPVLNLIKQLVNKGHSVSVLTESWYKSLIEKSGAKHIPFKEHFIKTDRTKDMFDDWKNKNNGFDNVIFGPSEIVVNETIEAIKANKIDLLIADVILPAALIAGEAMKIKTVCLFHMPEYLPGPNRPPGGLGLIPGQNALGRFRDKLLGKVFNKIFNKYLPKINAIRKSLNLDEQINVADIFSNCNLRLIQTSDAFDFPILPAPKNIKYVGPVLDDPDWVEDWKTPFDKEDKRPLVVVALSTTFQNQKNTIQNCIDALGKLNVKGLVTLGIAMENEQFNIPQNVKVINGASHAQIFPYADCVITHAGHGTVMRALANGVPMVCLPMGRDQGDNAAKVSFHGTGIKISAKSNSETISKAVKKIIQNTEYKKNAKTLGAKILADSKKGDIVNELENLQKKNDEKQIQPVLL